MSKMYERCDAEGADAYTREAGIRCNLPIGHDGPPHYTPHCIGHGRTRIRMTEQKIKQAMDDTPVGHRDSLFGERAAGSRWGRAFTEDDWDKLLPLWRKFEPVEAARMAGCTYYEASIRGQFPKAVNGALPWGALDKSHQAFVKEVDGAHGPELQLAVKYWMNAQARLATSMATLIVGPDEGKQIVYTMHPGLPLAPYDGESRTFATAVKLVKE